MSELVELSDCFHLYRGDCREILPELAGVDCIIADPPYGETDLSWDIRIDTWPWHAFRVLKPKGSMWLFGSLRSLLRTHECLFEHWCLSQEIIWEKQNGTNFHADRFNRVHEIITHWYLDRSSWADVYKHPVTSLDADKRRVRRRQRPTHMRPIDGGQYETEDGGERLMRSVIHCRNCHGYAIHPTQKPTDLLEILIEYACPPGGIVLDPFMGSGSIAIAAHARGRRYIGIEIDNDYFDAARLRIDQALRQQKLFA